MATNKQNVNTTKTTMKGERKMREWQTLNLYQEDNLLIDEEAVLFAPKVSEYGNVFGVANAGLADLPALETIEISDNDRVSDVEKKLADMLYDLDMNGCQVADALEISEDFDVVYCHKLKKFMAVSEMNFYPVYLYWNKEDFEFESVWLKEPEHTIDASGYAAITIADEFGHTEIYEIYRLDYEPVYDKYLLRYITQEDQPSGEIISEEELGKLLDNTKNHMKGAK